MRFFYLTFYKKSVDTEHFNQARSVKALLWEYYLQFALGVKFNPKLKEGKLIFAVSDGFLAYIGAKDIAIPDNLGIVKTRIAEKYNMTNKKILFCVGGIIEDNLINQDEYIEKNNGLIEALCKYFRKDEISLKLHPRFTSLYSKEKTLDFIQNHVPGNLIIDHFDIVIGYSSAILFEAANMGKMVLSTLKYFTPLNEQTQNQYIDYLQSNLIGENKIHYFSKLKELEYSY